MNAVWLQEQIEQANDAGFSYGKHRCIEDIRALAKEYKEHHMWDYYMLLFMVAAILEAK